MENVKVEFSKEIKVSANVVPPLVKTLEEEKTVMQNDLTSVKNALLEQGTITEDTPTNEYGNGVKKIVPFQKLLDNRPSATYLFQSYEGEIGFIKDLDFSKINGGSNMFWYAKLTDALPVFDTSNFATTKQMFGYCNLTTVPALNMSNVNDFTDMFFMCSNIKSILMYGMKKKFNIVHCKPFEISDLITLMSNCQVVTSTQTLGIGSANLTKLDGVYVKKTGVELYEGITCNPCVMCESTDEGAMLATDYMSEKGWTLA